MKGFAPCRRPLNSGCEDATLRCLHGLPTADHLYPIGSSKDVSSISAQNIYLSGPGCPGQMIFGADVSRIYICSNIYLSGLRYAGVFMYACMYVCMSMYVHVCMYVYVCMYGFAASCCFQVVWTLFWKPGKILWFHVGCLEWP